MKNAAIYGMSPIQTMENPNGGLLNLPERKYSTV